MLINLRRHEKIIKSNAARCREKGILLPTFQEMIHPETIDNEIKEKLKSVGLWDVNPLNLYRINWHNERKESGGLFSSVNYIEIPREITGTKARIIALCGKFFPCGVHKVGATYACLAPALVSGNFDAVNQMAVWPSTGNYCRGGAYNSALLGCSSIAILPEDMSKERFDWLKSIAGEVIATPGCESNVKEIFDKCHELDRERGKHIVIFNQFEQFENYLWHYEVTGAAIIEVLKNLGIKKSNVKGYVSSTGSGGTLAAGDHLKRVYPNIKIGSGEALQCPTLLRNGFGGHRIEGIGDKHVPWIHNVRNTDMVLSIDDEDCMNVYRLFNEKDGLDYLRSCGVSEESISDLSLFGISGIGNLLASIKMAKYYEMDEADVVFTILTDSSVMYTSRLAELEEQKGAFSATEAAKVHASALMHQGIDNALELTYYDRLRIHNLKYYTWVEQQGKTYEELNRQWYDPTYWARLPKMTKRIDELIRQFNDLVRQ
ncbi:MAG TPA: pyridoxal-phosphate dependent enzyme [Candidatus Ornithospirochaeta avicola]|uniref:Pyridoxal-phosphate dependent enzyme n=1 Tax=Candidatus Ornithospirochaeta avicola TaxID=2840896 RepID=A0A9D1TN09_9SPIO|nr:pyridoxal-phosphate dependent enzyme [Candidatus Ornithospirochaeta avicola]